MNIEPRDFCNYSALPGSGMPGDRLARMAARRTFVDLKASFLQAVDGLPGERADWLRRQLRRAEEPIDLWMLRSAVFEELERGNHGHGGWPSTLHRSLDTVFPVFGRGVALQAQ